MLQKHPVTLAIFYSDLTSIVELFLNIKMLPIVLVFLLLFYAEDPLRSTAEGSTVNRLPLQYSTVNRLPIQYSTVNRLPLQYSTVIRLPLQYSTVNRLPLQYSTVQ